MSRSRVLALLVAVAVAAGAGGASLAARLPTGPAVRASNVAAFHTPQEAADCVLPVNFAEGATTPWRLMCWTPNDGFTIDISYNGRARRTTLSEVGMSVSYVRQSARRTLLAFGRDWTCCFDQAGFGTLYYACSSRSTGLTCKNRAGHGWWLGRFKGYRIF